MQLGRDERIVSERKRGSTGTNCRERAHSRRCVDYHRPLILDCVAHDNGPPDPVFLYFDGSVRYDSDGQTPISAACGYSIETAGTVLREQSVRVPQPVSSTHAEYHALLQAARSVGGLSQGVESLYVYGDSESVLDVVDPKTDSVARDRFGRWHVTRIQSQLSEVPIVGYRAVSRDRNSRAHWLATRGHDPANGN